MTTRNASFVGSNGAAWPNLDTGDAWGTGFWSSPSKTTAQYDSITSTLNGSGSGGISFGINPEVAAASLGSFSTTNASSAGRYTISSLQSSASNVNLLYVCTTWTAAHYHQIVSASCTGPWLNLTYDLVTSYDWSSSGIFYRMSVFRTVPSAGSTGNVLIDVYDTATSSIVATQATGINFAAISTYGCDTSSNGANAVRAANTTTNTGTTGQPNVTLPNSLSKYSSLPIAFFATNANTTMGSGSSDSAVMATGSYATPVHGMAIVRRTQPALASVKTQRTMTANFGTSTVKWGAIGIELLRSTTQDTYVDMLADYTYARIAANTAQPQYQSAEVRASTDVADAWGPYTGLIGRYVVSGGTKYWIGTHVVTNKTKAEGNAYIFAVVDNGTTSSVTGFAFSTGAGNFYDGYDRQALRIRVLANGDLWCSAKYWTNASGEPAWPALSTDASTAQVVNGIYSTNDALRNATQGQVGLYFVYPSTSYPILVNGAWTGPSPGPTVSESWSAWSNSEFVVTGATSSVAGGGSVVASNGQRIALGSASVAGGGTLAATSGTRIALGSASFPGGGSLTAAGLHIDVAFALVDGGGALGAIGVSSQTAIAAPAEITLSSPASVISLAGIAEVATVVLASQDGDLALLPIDVQGTSAAMALSAQSGTASLAPLGVAATQALLTFSPQLGTVSALVAPSGITPQIILDAQLGLIIQGMIDIFGLAIGQPRAAMKIQNPVSQQLAGDPRAFWRVRGVTRQ